MGNVFPITGASISSPETSESSSSFPNRAFKTGIKFHKVLAAEQVVEDNDEFEDPVERMLKKTGCLEKHYSVQECIAETKDWRQCQEQVQNFKDCMKQYEKRKRKIRI